jgi:hypothetical protein
MQTTEKPQSEKYSNLRLKAVKDIKGLIIIIIIIIKTGTLNNFKTAANKV